MGGNLLEKVRGNDAIQGGLVHLGPAHRGPADIRHERLLDGLRPPEPSQRLRTEASGRARCGEMAARTFLVKVTEGVMRARLMSYVLLK